MADDEALLILGAVFLVGIFVLGLVATIANSLKSLLLEFGAPQPIAGEIGALVFAGLALAIILVVLKFVFSSA